MIHLWEQLTLAGKVDTVAEIFGDEYHSMLLELDDSETYLGGVYYNQACLYTLTGKLEKAIQVLGKALKMTPAFNRLVKRGFRPGCPAGASRVQRHL